MQSQSGLNSVPTHSHLRTLQLRNTPPVLNGDIRRSPPVSRLGIRIKVSPDFQDWDKLLEIASAVGIIRKYSLFLTRHTIVIQYYDRLSADLALQLSFRSLSGKVLRVSRIRCGPRFVTDEA